MIDPGIFLSHPTTANTASITGVTSFSDWTLADPAALVAPGVLALSSYWLVRTAPSTPEPVSEKATTHVPDYQMFDSLALQADGRVCVATIVSGRICVVDPLRGTVEYVDVPHDCHVTNICFGGADMRDAWITCSGRGLLLHARWPVPGLRLAFNG